MSCPWWKAWWHRRRRRVDRQQMWPVLRAMATKRYPDDDEAAVLLALKGWMTFIQQSGQEHWHCPCAVSERE